MKDDLSGISVEQQLITSVGEAINDEPETRFVQDNLPEPSLTFKTSDEIREYMNQYMQNIGIGLVIYDSTAGKKLYYRCDKSGVYKSTRRILDHERKRNTRSRRVNCGFKIHFNYSKKRGDWRISIPDAFHKNHERSVDARDHPKLRRRPPEVKAYIHGLIDGGMSDSGKILEKINFKYPELIISKRDIWNELYDARHSGGTGITDKMDSPIRSNLSLLSMGTDSNNIFANHNDDSVTNIANAATALSTQQSGMGVFGIN